MTKKCSKCNLEKTLDLFPNLKRSKDGKYPQCKECKSSIDKQYYSFNSDKVKNNAKNYYSNNKENILQNINKEAKSLYRKQYYEKNKHIELENGKQYKEHNKEFLSKKRSEYRKENRNKINEYTRNRKKVDPLFRLGINLRKRLGEVLRNKDIIKTQKLNDYIGCSKDELIKHIESQFKSNMNWENYGTVWNIDHIIPLSAGKTENHLYQLSHYKNLRPLDCMENFKKNNKIEVCWQKFQRDKNLDNDIKSRFNFNLTPSDFILSIEKLSLEHRKFIQKYEWLGTIGFGVKWVFTARYKDDLAGVVMVSEPNSYHFGKEEALIQRGAVSSWAPKNLNSKLVMFACRWMVRNTEKRIFTAYSDVEAGEIGTIYQACNFDYLGQGFGASVYYKLADGRVKGSRYFTRTSAMKKWTKELNIEWKSEWCKANGFQDVAKIPQIIKDYAKEKMKECEKVQQLSKHKYALLLNYGKNKINKQWIPKPYPKRIKD